MAFDGFLTRGIRNELSKLLVGGRIDKIYHPSRFDLIFVIHNNKEKYKLMISADSSHFGVYITDENYENPKTPSSFNMLLRKHLSGGKILGINQVEWERILEISIECKDEMGYFIEKKLIVEIMNKHSNVIITNAQDNKIIDAMKRVSIDTSSVRQLLPSMIYDYPPSQNKISPESFILLDTKDIESFRTHKDILNSVCGISPAMAINLFESSNSQSLMKDYIEKLNSDSLESIVYLDKDKTPKDFHTLPLNNLESLSKVSFDNISKGISYYYSHREDSNRLRQKSSALEKTLKAHIKKLTLKQSRLLDDMDKARRAEIYQLYGELLTANLHIIKDSSKPARVFNYYDNTEIEIPMDGKLSPVKNSQNYFKKFNKSKRALIEKENQLESTAIELSYLSTTLDLLQLADSVATIDEIKDELMDAGYIKERKADNRGKKSAKRDLLSYVSPTGKKVFVGRNNKENDYLSTKYASNSDLWFHTKDISGSHVILSLEGKAPEDDDIVFASQLAAYHSKGRLSENVPVDYTYIKYVKKPKGAKLGMVIFTDNKTIYVNPANIESQVQN